MDNGKFESFDEFCLKLNEDEKGVSGTLIDKTKSFIPRVMRFAKAKSVMKSYLRGFERKSLSLIKHFEKTVQAMSDTSYENFKKFKKDKLDALRALDKTDMAVGMAVNYKRDVASLKENELKKINASVDKILDSYTNAIDKRIDSPGFILNVELSDRGKGKLKAKWVELSAIKKMDVDEKLLRLLNDAGLEKLDEINAELDAFIEEHRYTYGKDQIEFYIDSVTEVGPRQYKVVVFLRAPGHRHALTEKGLLIGNTEEQVNDMHSARLLKMKNLVFSTYTMTINADETDYIRPYLKIANSIKPKFGNTENIEDMVNNPSNNGGQAVPTNAPRPVNLPGYGGAF